MKTRKPRVVPVGKRDWTQEQQEVMASVITRNPKYESFNVFGSLLRHPAALRAFQPWQWHVSGSSNTLRPRERELAMLRIGFLCRSGYEWAQHVLLGREAGLSDSEIEAIKVGAAANNWSEPDVAVLKACDELHSEQFVSDATWALLARSFSEQQRMDLVYTIGHYTLISMFLNTFGVPLDDFLTADPDLD